MDTNEKQILTLSHNFKNNSKRERVVIELLLLDFVLVKSFRLFWKQLGVTKLSVIKQLKKNQMSKYKNSILKV